MISLNKDNLKVPMKARIITTKVIYSSNSTITIFLPESLPLN